MNIIVERLTDADLALRWLNTVGPKRIMQEAADEIERLRAELESQHEKIMQAQKALEDSVQRMKSLLGVLNCDDEFIAHETEMARAALAKLEGVK